MKTDIMKTKVQKMVAGTFGSQANTVWELLCKDEPLERRLVRPYWQTAGDAVFALGVSPSLIEQEKRKQAAEEFALRLFPAAVEQPVKSRMRHYRRARGW